MLGLKGSFLSYYSISQMITMFLKKKLVLGYFLPSLELIFFFIGNNSTSPLLPIPIHNHAIKTEDTNDSHSIYSLKM